MTGIKTIVFDVYGTLFDVHSVIQKCEEMYPGRVNKSASFGVPNSLTMHLYGKLLAATIRLMRLHEIVLSMPASSWEYHLPIKTNRNSCRPI
jgi:FMN phosphatase YigB (HAD superfamily)